MKAPYFNVTARCNHQRCSNGTFTVQRKKAVKKSAEGNSYTIGSVVCPECRMWADVVDIETVES